MAGCIFCDIVARRTPASVVCEVDTAVAFLDLFPVRQVRPAVQRFALSVVLAVSRRRYSAGMDVSAREASSLLAALRSAPIPEGPVALSPLYLRRVARVEALPANQPGADKTWVAQALSRFRAHYQAVGRS